MALLTDFHVHTEISHDGRSSWYDMVMAEYRAGVRYLCVTDHCDTVHWRTRELNPGCLEIPRREREMFEQYRDLLPRDLNLRLGMEAGEVHYHPELLPRLTEAPWLDFILGSFHITKQYGDYYLLDYGDPAFRAELWDIYLDNLQQIADLDFFDVMAHIGYWRRYAWKQGIDEGLSLERHGDRVEALLKTLIRNGRGVEVNCSGLRDGCGPFPSEEILRLYRSLGGEIVTVGSDAHRTEDAAKCVAEGHELLQSIGFRYVTVFTRHRPEFIPLDR